MRRFIASAFRKRNLLLFGTLTVLLAACQEEPLNPGRQTIPQFHEEGVDVGGSHFRYATLSWAPTGNTGEVKFQLRASFRRDAYSGTRCIPANCSGSDGHPVTGDIIIESQGPTGFSFGDGSAGTPTLHLRVTSFSTAENWVIGEALNPGTTDVGILHTYSGSGPFTAKLVVSGSTADACCRIGQPGFATTALNNRAGGTYPIQTEVDVPLTGNSGPVSGMVPIVVVPPSMSAQFLVPASDPDDDPISWRLATAAEAGTGTPLHPAGLSVNASSGIVTWNNTGLDQTNFWTTQIVVEDQETKTPVDFLLKIQQTVGALPTCTLSPPGPFSTNAGNQISFNVTGNDPDVGATVTLNSGGLPAGATMSPPLPLTGSSGVSSTFNWTPTNDQVGSHAVVFSATDNDNQQGLCSTTMNVEPEGQTTQVVPANQAATVTVKENGNDVAGVDIPPNSFDKDVIVTVRFEELDAGEQCHESLFLQVGRCLEITIKEVVGGGNATPKVALTIGLCAPTALKGGRDLFEFKARDSRPIALEEVPEFFIDCPVTFASAPSGWLQKFARGLVNRVGGWFGATPLLAAVDDDGFGGSHPPGETFSTFFTWASQVQISDAGLVVDVFNSGEDAFGVKGSFDFSGTPGFAPSVHDVTVGFGEYVETIPKGSFKPQGGKFVYKKRTTVAIAYMEIHPDGTFGIAGSAPTEAATFRPFSLLIGQKLASTYRTQGVGLECAANGRCTVHPDP